MTKLLLKIFVKNYNDTDNDKVRENYGKLAGVVSIVINIILATFKMIVGLAFNALAILADGINNMTDCGSNVVSLISFKVSSKPADKEHPYGHARIEYIASMIVAFIVLLLAFELGKEAVGKIINPTENSFSILMIISLGVSILFKLWLFMFNKKLGKMINSDILKATATDSINDVLSTTAVLISVIIAKTTGFNLDGYMSAVVAIIIAIAGIGILRKMMSKLMGQAPDKELIDSIKKRILEFDGVYGIHDLNVHNYGPNKFYASVHVEVDASKPALESHDIIDQIERNFLDNTNITLVIHLDPIVINDPIVDKYHLLVKEVVADIDEKYCVHDFRMVKGVTHTNLIFDVAIPFDSKYSTEEIQNLLKTRIKQKDRKLEVVATVEKQIIE